MLLFLLLHFQVLFLPQSLGMPVADHVLQAVIAHLFFFVFLAIAPFLSLQVSTEVRVVALGVSWF